MASDTIEKTDGFMTFPSFRFLWLANEGCLKSVSIRHPLLFASPPDIKKVPKHHTSGLFLILHLKIAVRTGLEPVTPCVTGMYSNQLN